MYAVDSSHLGLGLSERNVNRTPFPKRSLRFVRIMYREPAIELVGHPRGALLSADATTGAYRLIDGPGLSPDLYLELTHEARYFLHL